MGLVCVIIDISDSVYYLLDCEVVEQMSKKYKYELYETFTNEFAAKRYANELRNDGYCVAVRKGDYGLRNGKRLTHGVYIGGFRK